jgi:uncharacterized cupin superfamily protein
MSKGADSIVVLGEGPVEEVRRTMDAGNVISGNPIMHTVKNYFEDGDRQLTAGVWESTAGKWHAFTGKHEFCYMLAGRVRLADKAGNYKEFVTGDSFVIPDGFEGTWEVLEDAKKIYVILKTD